MEGTGRWCSNPNGAVRATVTARIVGGGGDRAGSSPPSTGAATRDIESRRILSSVPLERFLCFASGSSSSSSSGSGLVHNFVNFKRSGAPSRVMFFRDEAWNHFPEAVVETLRAGLAAGKTAVEVPIEGSSYVIDFLGMSRTDLATGSQMSIGWIDENGKCFFPKSVVGDERSTDCPKLEIDIRIDDKGSAIPSAEPLRRNRASPEPPGEEQSGESSEISTTASPERPRLAGVEVWTKGTGSTRSWRSSSSPG